ncbi:MAG TPA: DUF4468 domain-containing protein [Prolixibacteraceae bacterium]|nr:DUF4468 domain-containing protein [Prolixibacteraceae bacterium]
MRKLLLVLLFSPLLSFAQEYSEVVEVPGKSVDQLYSSAREWFALTFKSATDVLKMDDPIAGKLIGKGSSHISESYVTDGLIKVPIKLDWYPSYTISIAIKDGRYKCIIAEITIKRIVEGSGIAPIETSFKEFFDQKDNFKNGRDPEWFTKNVEGAGKLSKNMIKNSAKAYESYYNIILKTEQEFTSLLASLQKKMKGTDDNW